MSPSSMPALNESSMKLSRMISRGGRSMARVLALWNGMLSGSECNVSSMGNGECNDFGSQFGSRARSNAMSPIASLTMLKKEGAGLLPKGRRPNMYAIDLSMVMQRMEEVALAWNRLYAASISVLLMNIFFDGWRRLMSCTP